MLKCYSTIIGITYITWNPQNVDDPAVACYEVGFFWCTSKSREIRGKGSKGWLEM